MREPAACTRRCAITTDSCHLYFGMPFRSKECRHELHHFEPPAIARAPIGRVSGLDKVRKGFFPPFSSFLDGTLGNTAAPSFRLLFTSNAC